MNMKELGDEKISLKTINGTEKGVFKRKVIKMKEEDVNEKNKEIHTMESIEVEEIGKQKEYTMGHVNIIAKLMELPPNIKNQLITEYETKNKEIEVIVSQRDGAKFLSEIIPEEIGVHHTTCYQM